MAPPLLLLTATVEEAEPLLDSLDDVHPLALPLGQGSSANFRGLPLHLVHLGVGKVNTAAGLALALGELEPSAVLQFGIGGAYPGSFFSIGMTAFASEELDLDAGLGRGEGHQGMKALGFPLLAEKGRMFFDRFPTDPEFTHLLSDDLGLAVVNFGTSDAVTADFEAAAYLQERFDLAIESMEGVAAAQTCLALGVPFVEVRSVSNIVGERNKEAWNIPLAASNAGKAVAGILEILARKTFVRKARAL